MLAKSVKSQTPYQEFNGQVPCCLLALQPGYAPTVSKGGKVPIQEILTFKFYHEGCKC